MAENGTVLARAVVVLEGDSKKLEEMMSASEKKMMKLGEGMKTLGEHLTTHLTLELVAMGTEAVLAFGEQEDAMARTNAILKATGESAGVSAGHIKELAESLQDVTTFSSDVTQSASGMLLTFEQVQNRMGKGNDIFDRSVKIGQDLATLMGGDLQSAVRTLGVALEDPTNGLMMLRREGIKFTAVQMEMIKNMYENNNVLGAQKMILDILQGKIGGLAKAMANTPLSQFKRAWSSIQDAMKPFGEILMKAITPVLHGIEALANWFKNLSEEAKTVIVIIAAIVAATGPLLMAIGTIIVAFTALSAVFGAALAPILIVIGVIGLIILAGYELVKHWTWVKLKLVEFWGFVEHIYYTSIDYILGLVQMWMMALSSAVSGLKRLPGVLGDLGTALAEPFDAALQAVTDLRDGAITLAELSEGKTKASVAKLTAELAKQEKQAKKTGAAIVDTAKAKPLPPVWLGPATAALDDLSSALVVAHDKEVVLGDAFDETAAQAEAYSSVVDALLKAHVPLTVSLDAARDSVKSFMLQLQQLKAEDAIKVLNLTLKDAGKQASVLGKAFDFAGAKASAYEGVVSTLIGLQVDLDTVIGATGLTLRQLMKDMQAAKIEQISTNLSNSLDAAAKEAQVLGANFDYTGAKINAYDAAVQAALAANVKLSESIKGTNMTLEQMIKVLQKLKEQQAVAQQLQKTFTDLGDYLVDWAYGAKKSFGDFVRQALIDLTKLIVKMLILQELKQVFNPEKGGVLGSIGKVLGFADGGFIKSGTVGLVGERGPELISGGRNGVSITPIPAMNAAAGSGGDVIHVELNVNAIDQKGVTQFFQENTDQIAGALMRARQKSTTFRRMMGG